MYIYIYVYIYISIEFNCIYALFCLNFLFFTILHWSCKTKANPPHPAGESLILKHYCSL